MIVKARFRYKEAVPGESAATPAPGAQLLAMASAVEAAIDEGAIRVRGRGRRGPGLVALSALPGHAMALGAGWQDAVICDGPRLRLKL